MKRTIDVNLVSVRKRELYFTIKNSFDNIWNKKDSNRNLQ